MRAVGLSDALLFALGALGLCSTLISYEHP
jgi:hypothetical protein